MNTTLKTEEKTVKIVDHHDLDDFISFHYSLPFSVVADQELNNYSYKMVTVESKPLDEWEQEDLRRLSERREYSTGVLNALMTDLCNRGFLDSGSYLIRVFW